MRDTNKEIITKNLEKYLNYANINLKEKKYEKVFYLFFKIRLQDFMNLFASIVPIKIMHGPYLVEVHFYVKII